MSDDNVAAPEPDGFDGAASAGFQGALGAVLVRNGVAIEEMDLENRPIDYSPLARLGRFLNAWRKR